MLIVLLESIKWMLMCLLEIQRCIGTIMLWLLVRDLVNYSMCLMLMQEIKGNCAQHIERS